tara:strand:+ start:250 stop:633 length:384 start_codon:yes stop_codon:yes gene_type:complete
MFAGYPFLILGIIFLVLHRSYLKDTSTALDIHNFWKSFNEKYPKELKDAVNKCSYNYDIGFLYELSNTEAYKKLSKEVSAELIDSFKRIRDLEKELGTHEKFVDYSFMIGGWSIGIFIFSIYFYSVN